MSGRIRSARIRQPSTLLASTIATHIGSLNIWGARQVGFLVSATNPEILQAATITIGNNGTNWNSVGTNTAVDVAGSLTSVPLHQGGRWFLLVPGPGLNARYSEVIHWKFCRIQLTADVVDITGLTVDQYVWDDILFARYGKGEQPTPIGV